MTPEERFARAGRAKAAYDEFLAPAILLAKADYAQRLTDVAENTPWEADRITKLAVALKVARTVDEQIRAIIADGQAAEADIKSAVQIEKIPSHKRSILGL